MWHLLQQCVLTDTSGQSARGDAGVGAPEGTPGTHLTCLHRETFGGVLLQWKGSCASGVLHGATPSRPLAWPWSHHPAHPLPSPDAVAFTSQHLWHPAHLPIPTPRAHPGRLADRPPSPPLPEHSPERAARPGCAILSSTPWVWSHGQSLVSTGRATLSSCSASAHSLLPTAAE